MDLPRSVLINTLSQLLSRFGTILLSLITTSILTRALGKAGYGQFGFITALAIFFATLADWGTHTISVREASKNPESANKIFVNSAILRTLVASIATIIYIGAVFYYSPLAPFRESALLATPLIFLLSLRTSAMAVHQVRLRLYIPATTELITNIVFMLFVIAAINQKIPISLNYTILAIVAGTLVNSLATFIPVAKLLLFPQASFSQMKFLFKEALPMGTYLIIFSIYNRVDTIFLQYFQGNAATGIYALSYKIHENLILGAAYLMNSLYPIISRDNKHHQEYFTKLFNFMIAAGVLVLIAGNLLAPLAVNILGGSQFAESTVVLRILLMATAVAYLNHLTGYFIIILGFQRVSLIFSIIALAINVTLNLFLIPKYSYFAAALVTFITESSMLILSLTYLVKKHKLKIDLSLLPSQIRSGLKLKR